MPATVWRISPHAGSNRPIPAALEALAAAIDERRHWQVTDGMARYTPPAGAPVALVRPIKPTDNGERYHVAIVHDGAARRSRLCRTAEEAIEWAEEDHPL